MRNISEEEAEIVAVSHVISFRRLLRYFVINHTVLVRSLEAHLCSRNLLDSARPKVDPVSVRGEALDIPDFHVASHSFKSPSATFTKSQAMITT